MRHTGRGLCHFPTSCRERTSPVLKRSADSQIDCHSRQEIVTPPVAPWNCSPVCRTQAHNRPAQDATPGLPSTSALCLHRAERSDFGMVFHQHQTRQLIEPPRKRLTGNPSDRALREPRQCGNALLRDGRRHQQPEPRHAPGRTGDLKLRQERSARRPHSAELALQLGVTRILRICNFSPLAGNDRLGKTRQGVRKFPELDADRRRLLVAEGDAGDRGRAMPTPGSSGSPGKYAWRLCRIVGPEA